MFNAMILLTSRDNMTPQDFRDWWINQHARMAQQLLDVRRIIFIWWQRPPTPSEAQPGWPVRRSMASPSCGSTLRERLEAAYSTDFGRQVIADSVAHVSQRVRMFVDETPILSS